MDIFRPLPGKLQFITIRLTKQLDPGDNPFLAPKNGRVVMLVGGIVI